MSLDLLNHMDWAAFLVAMAIVELTPGPNMGWLASLSASTNRRTGLVAVAGITLGLALQLALAVTGLSALIAASPFIYQALRWAGVAFMVYLAWEIYRETGEASPIAADGMVGFRRGLIANILNPKALVFYIAVVGQFADPASGPLWLQIVLLGCIHLLLAILVHTAIVMVGSHVGERIGTLRTSLPVRIGFALSLLGIALWIALST